MNTVPEGFFETLCENMSHPAACVDLENRFQWVNTSFEKLVGYSISELIGATWMSITDQQNVGGDLASVADVLSGKIHHYTMFKKYRHKRGHLVPVEITVRRFPMSPLEQIVCFQIEAPPSRATRPELDELERNFHESILVLKNRIDEFEHRGSVNVRYGDDLREGDKVGRDKNSDAVFKFLAICFTAMAITMAWLFYYVSTLKSNIPPQPPQQMELPK